MCGEAAATRSCWIFDLLQAAWWFLLCAGAPQAPLASSAPQQLHMQVAEVARGDIPTHIPASCVRASMQRAHVLACWHVVAALRVQLCVVCRFSSGGVGWVGVGGVNGQGASEVLQDRRREATCVDEEKLAMGGGRGWGGLSRRSLSFWISAPFVPQHIP